MVLARPTARQLAMAVGGSVPDLIRPGLLVLFCGINPSLYSAAVGHHFARPGNRFWPALFLGGFTNRVLTPYQEDELLEAGCGIVNFVNRATSSAAHLRTQEIIEGGRELCAKVHRFRPRVVAILGVDAYRKAFHVPRARVGKQLTTIEGTTVWVVPNPSGINAHYQLPELGRLFGNVREDALATRIYSGPKQVKPRVQA